MSQKNPSGTNPGTDRWAPALFVIACCLLLAGFFSGLVRAAAVHESNSRQLSILVYHRFDADTPASTTVTLAAFEEQLAWLAAHHVQVVPLHSLVAALRGTGPAIEGPAVAICSDDGHQSVYSLMYPIIKRDHLPVTLFIYPSAISNASYAMTWEQLKEMEASGLVDVQSHTYWHPNFNTERKRQNPDDFKKFVDTQLTKSRHTLEGRMGHPIDLLAWPFGIHDPELEEAAARAGYVAAFALDGRSVPENPDLFAIPRYMIGDRDRGTRLAELLDLHNPNLHDDAPHR